MCCNDARMGMISSRQLVLSRTSSTGSQPRRSCGSKGMRSGESLEEVPAGNPEIGGSPRIHTRDIRDLRGESWQKSQKTRSNRFFRRALTTWRIASNHWDGVPNSHRSYRRSETRNWYWHGLPKTGLALRLFCKACG